MNLLSIILPAIVIGSIALLTKERLPWWSVPIIVFFTFLGYQVFLFYSKFSLPVPANTDIAVEVNPDIGSYLPGILLTSLYFSLLSLVFVIVGIGFNRILSRYLGSEILRIFVATYITLLFLQLWVEVFPWTLLVPLRFYSLSP